MNEEQMRDLVKECDLDWQRGYVTLFDGDVTNRYEVLIGAAVAAERERSANKLNLTQSQAMLHCGEMTAGEWRTVAAVLCWMQTRIRDA